MGDLLSEFFNAPFEVLVSRPIVWAIFALLLAAIEMSIGEESYLGFTTGASLTALLCWIIGPGVASTPLSWALPVLIFAILSGIAVYLLRKHFGGNETDDINERPYNIRRDD